jgi:hypothetical protein
MFRRINIERYPNPDEIGYSVALEGESDDGGRWIMFLDNQGRPKVFWPKREPDGAIVGDGILLTRQKD